MKTAEDIESYLIQMEAQYESVGEEMWVVKDIGPDLVLSMGGPVLVFRIKVTDLDKIPQKRKEKLYRTLLELNVGEMLHGAYGIEGDSIIVTAALQLENLDFNEFQAVMDDIGMAVTNHYDMLSTLAA